MGLINSIIGFFTDLINQLLAFIQSILDFLKVTGNSLLQAIENISTIIIAFLIITIGAMYYNKK